jgi:hypothetical protein
MAVTNAGCALIWRRFAEALENGTIVVGNGEAEMAGSDTDLTGAEQASTPISEIEILAPDDEHESYRLLLRGTFGPDEANFDWRERGVKQQDGTLVDRTVSDGGRKAPGFTVTIEHEIDLIAERF